MNLILFESEQPVIELAQSDPRTHHIRAILRMSVGDVLFVGATNARRGKAQIIEDSSQGIKLEVSWDQGFIKPLPITILAGTPRPQTARRLLQEGACMGISSFFFFNTDKGEPSYRDSKLWTTDEWRRHLITGAEQAFATTIPEVTHRESLIECIEAIADPTEKFALDNYESTQSLASISKTRNDHYTLAIGAERGWSGNERDVLRDGGFTLVNLGERVLKMETALIAATTLLSQFVD